MAQIIWAPAALRQLEEIAETIALDSEPAARRVVSRIVARVERLADFPRSGRAIPELHLPGYRQLWAKPCWVYYRHSEGVVVIIHVRRPERLFRLDALFNED